MPKAMLLVSFIFNKHVDIVAMEHVAILLEIVIKANVVSQWLLGLVFKDDCYIHIIIKFNTQNLQPLNEDYYFSCLKRISAII